MKKISLSVVFFLFLFIVAISFWWIQNTKPVSSGGGEHRFVVVKGESAERVGKRLEKNGIIKSSLAFKIYVQFFDKQKSINSGEFKLSSSMKLFEIVDVLGGNPLEMWVTVPEGLRREEVAEIVISELGMDEEKSANFRRDFLKLTKEKEGYLFPDTYLLSPDIDASEVVNLMRNTFDKRIDEKIRKDIEAKGLTLEKVVILASIVERETKEGDERPIVAGVYFNRLEIGQALQADATVQYALGNKRCADAVGECDWWIPPKRNDLEIDSPYNTYKYSGIIPGPIASAGLSSIKAVVYSKETPYFYYIHDSSGKIYFAKTLSEHNQNIQKYLY